MVRLEGRISGQHETSAQLQATVSILMEEVEMAARASLFQTTRLAQKHYLSGPRPSRLGVVTNRLRGSLSEGAPELIVDVQRQALKVHGRIGTNVIYAPMHEFGAVIKPKKGRYLAIPTALAKTPAGALKDRYNRPLREIEHLFIARSRSGTLFAAERQPATGRQQRSVFRVLFWLVRRVTIPARPFLNPALRDATPWIQERFQQALRRTEQRVISLLQGR
jgi:phage gpG-like protein